MKHFTNWAALPVETRNDDDNPADLEAAIAAVNEIRTNVTARLAGIDEITARLDEIEARAQRPGNEDHDEPSAETRAFGDYLRRGDAAVTTETRAIMQVSSDPQGGYLAPKEFSSEFVRELTEISPVRQVASIRSTGNGSVVYPKRTSVTNATWRGEVQEQTESDVDFGQAEITVHEISTFVDISNTLLADSGGDAEREVRGALAEDVSNKEGTAFLLGTGANQPQGILVNTDITEVASGMASNLSADSLINAFYDLPAAYRNSAAWGMNSTTLAALRKLKDGNGNYLWHPGLAGGQPDTLLGRPIVDLPGMPDVGAGFVPIVVGDFSGYRIVDRVGMSILVNPYLRATNGITRFHLTRRVGGGVLQASKFRKLKIADSV